MCFPKETQDDTKTATTLKKSGIPCLRKGTEICYKKCRFLKEESIDTCTCICCPEQHKQICMNNH